MAKPYSAPLNGLFRFSDEVPFVFPGHKEGETMVHLSLLIILTKDHIYHTVKLVGRNLKGHPLILASSYVINIFIFIFIFLFASSHVT